MTTTINIGLAHKTKKKEKKRATRASAFVVVQGTFRLSCSKRPVVVVRGGLSFKLRKQSWKMCCGIPWATKILGTHNTTSTMMSVFKSYLFYRKCLIKFGVMAWSVKLEDFRARRYMFIHIHPLSFHVFECVQWRDRIRGQNCLLALHQWDGWAIWPHWATEAQRPGGLHSSYKAYMPLWLA